MVAGNASSARVWPWTSAHHQFLYALAPLSAFAIAWWMSGLVETRIVWVEVMLYGLIHLTLIAARRTGIMRLSHSVGLGLMIDLAFSFLLLYQGDALGLAFYPLYVLLALRALSVYQLTPAATIIPFALGPIFLFSNALNTPFAQLAPGEQRVALLLLVGSLGLGMIAIWASTTTVRTNAQLQHALRDAQRATDLRVAQLERSANDLRARMREQHALEEGLRVITSSLSLDEVLSQIVDSTLQMLGPHRASAVALSLVRGDIFEHRLLGRERYLPSKLADTLATRALAQQVPLIINDLSRHSALGVIDHDSVSALSVPVFVGGGTAHGALSVVSADSAMFDSVDARHLSALATQAGIAIQNAELHSKMLQQQQLLAAVMRDITEGMVVLNAQLKVVLTNPLGRRLMDELVTGTEVRDQVLQLAETMRSEGKQFLAREVRIGVDDFETEATVYQALASLVHQQGTDEPLIAVVLHDITAQKAEERGKQEFISMVAHELRNPLHSIKGFVNIVLKGSVGPLTDMQQEFLGIVESQVGLLNGRIAELLEYNRVQSGKLVLKPQPGDLPMLVAGTVMRLSLQAQNNGLTLLNEVAGDLPECSFDNERIGQVLTNLVENAIKATPPGGTIRVTSELHEHEVWLRVYDTGVGIPPEDQHKIFQAFYRAHDRASSKGNHLGLGLTICAQIIEGHGGRIWVESEQGQGSCFSFALPLTARERSLGEPSPNDLA